MAKFKLVPADPNEEIQEIEVEHLELAKDKNHILVFNIDVGNIYPNDVPVFVEKVKQQLLPAPYGCIYYFIPHRGTPTTKIYKIDLGTKDNG